LHNLGLVRLLRKALGAERGREQLEYGPNEPAVILSPHFDDAVLDFWSILSSSTSVHVVNVFAAPPLEPCLTEWDEFCGATDSIEWTERRRAEDAAALALVGREAVNLPFRQASVRAAGEEPPPSVSVIAEAITKAIGTASAVLAPAGIGGHPDHLLVRSVAERLAGRGLPFRLFADLPYAVRTGGWPTWVDRDRGLPAANEEWSRFLRDIPQLDSRRAQVVTLQPDEEHAKLAALMSYETQFAHLDGPDRLLSRPGILRFEVSWGRPWAELDAVDPC
jgi:LmbE family N-acetylglucosaminyl deacetylase